MSRDASIEIECWDGIYRFALPIGQLKSLQEKCDAGPSWIYARIEAGMWKAEDLIETIRWGLIGGGKTPDEARKLVKVWVEGRPLWESVILAQKILAAAVAGPEDEPLKKAEGVTTETESGHSPTESSASPPSLEMAL